MIQKLDESLPPLPPYHRPHDGKVEIPVLTTTAEGEGQATAFKIATKPSLRTRRRHLTAACTAFTIGALFIICSSPLATDFLVPGPLSSHHAPLVAGEGADRCAACHANARGSMVSWIVDTFRQGKRQGLTQSQLCMKCHDQSLVAQYALNPHNVSPEQLAEISASHGFTDDPESIQLFPTPVNAKNELSCSTCHQEHHGERDMKVMTDAQCQSCHGQSFHRFEIDHPEFVNYPKQRRSRIAFDHASHAVTHFPGKQKEFNCRQCHIDDAFQNVKTLAPYEQSCAECHHQQILNSGDQGLAILALPMIDTEAIERERLDVGHWPLAATGDFDGDLPPLMKVMLTADPQARAIFDQLGPSFEFSDIDPTNPEQVRLAVEIVWAIKRLMYDLSLQGPEAVRDRLQIVMGLDISDTELQQIITNLDGPVFQNAVRRWLPELHEEMVERSEQPGNLVASRENEIKKSRVPWPSKDGVVFRIGTDDGRGSVEQASFPVVRVPKSNWRDPEENWSPNLFADPFSDPDLLAVNPLAGLMKTEEEDAPGEPPELPLVTTPRPPVAGRIGDPTPEEMDQEKSETEQATPVMQDGRPMVIPSGWFRNDRVFRISYRPSGHADRCLQSWIELVTRARDSDQRPETRELFEQTIARSGIGLCRNCHTVDQLPDRTFLVNWRAQYRDPSIRSFTHFSHGPHLLQPELQDCSHCHELDRSALNSESFLSVDGLHSVSNFSPVTRSDCTSCHQQGRVDNGCTQCHHYHVGSHVIGER